MTSPPPGAPLVDAVARALQEARYVIDAAGIYTSAPSEALARAALNAVRVGHVIVSRDTIAEAHDFIVGAKRLWLHADDPYINLLVGKLQAALTAAGGEVGGE